VAVRVELGEATDEAPDRDAVRAVARLSDGGFPAAGQALAGALTEGLAEHVVEERAEDELGGIALDRVANAAACGSSRASTAISIASSAASWSAGRKRAIVAPNAIGVGSAQASRSISSG